MAFVERVCGRPTSFLLGESDLPVCNGVPDTPFVAESGSSPQAVMVTLYTNYCRGGSALTSSMNLSRFVLCMI